MANKRRGEIDLTLDGKTYPLCLTFGALAELEDKMGLANIGELAGRFSNGQVRSADLIRILGVALRGGGNDVSDRQAASMRCEGGAGALAVALVELLQLTFNPEPSPPKTP
ncbi:gene transfer agent family protein [Cohaesibacter intestini]|uniref:gene transfer agent family protein n=1 Tax=Cohaesibacter intestini TaxID=2211145 RepID=UPI001300182A|nr:gene transfer agent family protein [Cohaesibacter intestini]